MSLFAARKPEEELEGLVCGKLGALRAARKKAWLFATLILLNVIFH